MPLLVIAAYDCEVAGKATDSVDYQVRYFESSSPDDAIARLKHESPQVYKNIHDEEVRWAFRDTIAIEMDPKFADNEEAVGFITGKSPNITEQVDGSNRDR